jgi:predicted hydrocarbon binding protein
MAEPNRDDPTASVPAAAVPAAVAGGLRQRLRWTPDGAVHDGPRRYLLMRPDVLMGLLRRLPDEARAQALAAFADSVADNGVDSIRAYFRQVGEDPSALLATTVAAAADLGWGAWRFEPGRARLGLVVEGSPFAAGHGPAGGPVCAPIAGMLRAVASVSVGIDVDVTETACVACGAPRCAFEARWAAC